jgi:hypothetical protein
MAMRAATMAVSASNWWKHEVLVIRWPLDRRPPLRRQLPRKGSALTRKAFAKPRLCSTR